MKGHTRTHVCHWAGQTAVTRQGSVFSPMRRPCSAAVRVLSMLCRQAMATGTRTSEAGGAHGPVGQCCLIGRHARALRMRQVEMRSCLVALLCFSLRD